MDGNLVPDKIPPEIARGLTVAHKIIVGLRRALPKDPHRLQPAEIQQRLAQVKHHRFYRRLFHHKDTVSP
jgi:hypothetical protein